MTLSFGSILIGQNILKIVLIGSRITLWVRHFRPSANRLEAKFAKPKRTADGCRIPETSLLLPIRIVRCRATRRTHPQGRNGFSNSEYIQNLHPFSRRFQHFASLALSLVIFWNNNIWKKKRVIFLKNLHLWKSSVHQLTCCTTPCCPKASCWALWNDTHGRDF